MATPEEFGQARRLSCATIQDRTSFKNVRAWGRCGRVELGTAEFGDVLPRYSHYVAVLTSG